MSSSNTYQIRFLPSGAHVRVPAGTTLREAAFRAGLAMETPCAGHGTCAKCRMRLRSGVADPAFSAARLTAEELARGWRLACQTRVACDLDLELPAATAPQAPRILLDAAKTESGCDEVYPPGSLGIAFDIGTTTLGAVLVALDTGTTLGSAGMLNPQLAFGSDLMSRIAAAQRLSELQRAVVAALNQLAGQLLAAHHLVANSICRLTVAGNTAMQEIFLGMDPSDLGVAPFTPAFTAPQERPADSVGLLAAPGAKLLVFPQIGGFVGGDTVAGLLAVDADRLPRPTLFVDIGTNGEMALITPDRILTASAAAGPAFEGGRIRQGMRAEAGAIDQLWVQAREFCFHTIADQPPRGLCGSGLIDAVSHLLRLGFIDSTGRLAAPPNADAAPFLSSGLLARLVTRDGEPAYRLAGIDAAAIEITQRDIRELQLATGAIRAGIIILLAQAGLTPADLDAVLLAGGFGCTLRAENALRIGLLPHVHVNRIRFLGNTSLAGAALALRRREAWLRAGALARRAEHIELASVPAFADTFASAMIFPDR